MVYGVFRLPVALDLQGLIGVDVAVDMVIDFQDQLQICAVEFIELDHAIIIQSDAYP